MTTVLTKIRNWLPRESFARGVLVLAGSTAAGQAISILATPLLTRLYQPSEFGVMTTFSAMLSLLSAVAALCYDLAIPLPQDDVEARHLVSLSFKITIAFSFLTLVSTWLFGHSLMRWVNHQELLPFLWLLPIGICGTTTYQIFRMWGIRNKRYSLIAQTRISQNASMTLVQILAGLLHLGPFGLLVGYVIGQTAGIGSLVRQFAPQFFKVETKREISIAKRYNRFPLHSTLPVLLNQLAQQFPALAIGALFGPKETGLYGMAFLLVGVPGALISMSTSNVFVAELASQVRQGFSARPLFWKTIKRQLVLAGVCLLFVPLLPIAGGTLLGEKWRLAGWYAMLISPAIAASVVFGPLGGVLDVLEKQQYYWHRELSRIALLILAYIVAKQFALQPVQTMALFGVTSAVSYCIYGLVCFHALNQFELQVHSKVAS